MLTSAQNNREAPWARNKWLGCCSHDHLEIGAALLLRKQTQNFDNIFDSIQLAGYKYQLKLRLAENEQLLNVSGALQFDSLLQSPHR